MNTNTLQRRMNRYVKPKIGAGNEDGTDVDMIDDLQSITDEDDHSIDTSYDTEDVVDAMYLPNPAIVEEMAVVLNPEAEVTNADTALKLLSDSNEALRRLDILRMNVNYPVSGYRMSQSTLLKAEPGLESMLGSNNLSKRKLNIAIEAVSGKLLAGMISVVIAAIGTIIFKAIARMRKRNNRTAPPTAEEIEAAKVAQESANKEKIQKHLDMRWKNLHPHARATILDIPATEDRIDMIITLGQTVDKEINLILEDTRILEKAAYDGDFSELDKLLKLNEVNSKFYDLAGELEDAMAALNDHSTTITPDTLSTQVSIMANSLKKFDTVDYQRTASKIDKLKSQLETLRARTEKMQSIKDGQDEIPQDSLNKLQKGVRAVAARGMNLAMAYRAADNQDIAITQAYWLFADYLKVIESKSQ